ncbi:MAG: DUF3662 and FHA domain-containing protein [Anaerolineae bacterium]|nr:MAG: DUF3662 and FHA domain-containing protein [Anaerolineae bacterium]
MIDVCSPQIYNPGLMGKLKPLSIFERFARRLVEGSIDRLLLEEGDWMQVARQLISVADASEIKGLVANEYAINYSPKLLTNSIGDQNKVAEELEGLLEEYLAESNREMAGSLKLRLILDSSLGSNEFSIEAYHSDSKNELTRRYRRTNANSIKGVLHDQQAYLIIGGKRHVPINKAALTIGRHLDNDIVIESSTVSRHHAQIKWRYGQFILYDLGSRTGTLINGHQVSDSVLKPGDVIDVGNIKIIFGEGGELGVERNFLVNEKGDTKPLPPLSEE